MTDNASVDENKVDEEQAEEKIAYEVKSTEDQPGSVKRYLIEVERAVYDGQLDETFQTLRKTVQIEGFRAGKAPVGLLRKRFGKDAEKDAVGQLAESVTHQLISEQNLKVIGEPQLFESTVEDAKPVCLSVDIEVFPDIEVQGYKDRTYEIELEQVTDDVIASQLETIRQANATYDKSKKKGAKYASGDAVTLDIEVVDKDGQRMESLCQTDMFMREPQGHLLSEVAESLKGHKVGDSWSVDVERTVGEEETHRDTYTLTLKEIKISQLPELDDAFASEVGDFENLSDLRARIEEDLKKQSDQEKTRLLMDQLLEHLIASNEFEAPKSLLAQQHYQMIERDMRQMGQLGLNLEAMGMSTDDYVSRSKGQSERFVKSQLILRAIQEKEDLKVTDEDLDKVIEKRAEAEGRKPLAIRARLEKEGMLDKLREDLIVGKVEDFLLASNDVKVIEPKKAKTKKEVKMPKKAKTKKSKAE